MTGLAVSERYIVAQYFMEPKIDVFDRKSLKLLHRLEGTNDKEGQSVIYHTSSDSMQNKSVLRIAILRGDKHICQIAASN